MRSSRIPILGALFALVMLLTAFVFPRPLAVDSPTQSVAVAAMPHPPTLGQQVDFVTPTFTISAIPNAFTLTTTALAMPTTAAPTWIQRSSRDVTTNKLRRVQTALNRRRHDPARQRVFSLKS